MTRHLPTIVILAGLFLAWQSVLLAREPGAVPDAAETQPAAAAKEFIVAVHFVTTDGRIAAPRVRLRDGQAANVMDRTQTPFVIGQTLTLGIKSPAIRVVQEGFSIEVRTTSTDDAEHVLVDLVAERDRLGKVAERGGFQSVRVKTEKQTLHERVKLGDTLRLDFGDEKLELVVTAAD